MTWVPHCKKLLLIPNNIPPQTASLTEYTGVLFRLLASIIVDNTTFLPLNRDKLLLKARVIRIPILSDYGSRAIINVLIFQCVDRL